MTIYRLTSKLLDSIYQHPKDKLVSDFLCRPLPSSDGSDVHASFVLVNFGGQTA
jgi:hypothetical protein